MNWDDYHDFVLNDGNFDTEVPDFLMIFHEDGTPFCDVNDLLTKEDIQAAPFLRTGKEAWRPLWINGEHILVGEKTNQQPTEWNEVKIKIWGKKNWIIPPKY